VHTLNLIINDGRTADNCDLDNPIFDLNDNDFNNYTSRNIQSAAPSKQKWVFAAKTDEISIHQI
jgi:hypothetical protein